ncbi:MAG: hypothetical protein ACPL7B_10920, partial [Candidatus Poribacteria bacterium]
MHKRAFYLKFIVAFIILLMQFNYANADSKNLDLQTALKKMQFAKSHSGYTFDQMEKCLFPYIATITDNWKNMPLLM